MRKIKRWTREEEDYLRENYSDKDMPVKQMAERLDCSEQMVFSKAHLMGLQRRKPGVLTFLSDEQYAYYLNNKTEKTEHEIAEDLGMTHGQFMYRLQTKVRMAGEQSFELYENGELISRGTLRDIMHDTGKGNRELREYRKNKNPFTGYFLCLASDGK